MQCSSPARFPKQYQFWKDCCNTIETRKKYYLYIIQYMPYIDRPLIWFDCTCRYMYVVKHRFVMFLVQNLRSERECFQCKHWCMADELCVLSDYNLDLWQDTIRRWQDSPRFCTMGKLCNDLKISHERKSIISHTMNLQRKQKLRQHTWWQRLADLDQGIMVFLHWWNINWKRTFCKKAMFEYICNSRQ